MSHSQIRVPCAVADKFKEMQQIPSFSLLNLIKEWEGSQHPEKFRTGSKAEKKRVFINFKDNLEICEYLFNLARQYEVTPETLLRLVIMNACRDECNKEQD